VTAEVPLFDRIFKLTNGPLKVGVFYVNESSPEYSDLKKKFKIGSKLPQLRFYPNNQFGEDKNQKSFEIYLKDSKFEAILDEIHEGVEHDVRETSEKILLNVAQSYAVEEKKNVVFYFYQEGRVPLHLKALSAMQILKDDFVFMSVTGPSQDLMDTFQLQKLPALAGLLPPAPEQPEAIR
jgi:hypothetical protein